MNNDIGQPEQQLGYLLTQASFLRQRLTNAALRELDITYIQFIVLAAVMNFGGDGSVVTQQDISARRRLDKAMVSNVVKTLTSKGLLLRERHPDDKRAFALALTDAGAEKTLRGRQIVRRVDEDFFAGTDQKEVFELFTKLLGNDNKTNE